MPTNPLPAAKRVPKQLIIILASIIAVNAAVWLLVAAPARGDYKTAKDTTANMKLQIEALNHEYTMEQITEEQLHAMAKKLPEKMEDSVVIEQILAVAHQSQVHQALFAQQTAQNEGEAASTSSAAESTVPFDLTIVGHLDHLISFIDQLQQYERLFTVQNWTFDELTEDVVERDYPDLYQNTFIDKNKDVLELHITVQAYAGSAAAR